MRKHNLFAALILLISISACATGNLFSSGATSKLRSAELVNIFLPEALCAGVQIDTFRAITAAHCLYNKEGGRVVNLEEIRVVKSVDMSHVSVRVSSVEMLPGFAIESRAVDNFNYDVAILNLSDVMPGNFHNLSADREPLHSDDELSTIYYKNVNRHLQLIQTPCRLLNRKRSVLVLDCPVDFGASGAPVYRLGRNGLGDLVAIIVAKARWGNKQVALAVKIGSV